jgi:hypothetical protein
MDPQERQDESGNRKEEEMNLEARKPGFYRTKRIRKKGTQEDESGFCDCARGNKSGNTTAGQMNLEARKPGLYRRKRIRKKERRKKESGFRDCARGNKSGNTTAGRDESGSQEARILSEETN